MTEREASELDLRAAFAVYLEGAPTQVRPAELARHFATAYPRRRAATGRWSFGLTPATAWVLLLAGLLLALVVGGLIAGAAAAPGPLTIVSGRWPKMVAALVINTGLRRTSEASRTALILPMPRRCIWLANSTMRIPFFDTRPTSVTRPTCE